MRIKSLRVQNYRSILDAEISFDDLTILIGSNGAGKSSFLNALELFRTKSSNVTEDDFYYKDTNKDIIFDFVFKNFNECSRKQFEKYIFKNELKLEYRIKWNNGKPINSIHGYRLKHKCFEEVRSIKDTSEKKEKYNELCANQKYSSLLKYTSSPEVNTKLEKWEADHIDECDIMTSDDNFFENKNSGIRYLVNHMRIIYTPAVKNAAIDAEEGRGSILSDLKDILVNKSLENDEEFNMYKKHLNDQWKEKFQKKYNDKLSDLSSNLTDTLKKYELDSKIKLSPGLIDIAPGVPTVKANLFEDGYESTVDRTGHGLQRLFIITMLEEISKTNTNSKTKNDISESTITPTFILIIDEPEIYQHPVRQRTLFRKLCELSKTNNSNIQIIFSTHSPYFIDIGMINNVRLLCKVENNELPKTTKVSQTTKNKIAQELCDLYEKPNNTITEDNLALKLYSMRTPLINEGFFSKCIVLVEGDCDKNAIIGAAEKLGKHLDEKNISVIACGGKSKLDKPTLVFKLLGIKTFVIWDKDNSRKNKKQSDNDKRINKKLIKLCTMNNSSSIFNEKYSYVCDDFAYMINNLEDMLNNEINDNKYNNETKKYMKKYGLDDEKSPEFPRLVLENLQKNDIPITLIQILKRICPN